MLKHTIRVNSLLVLSMATDMSIKDRTERSSQSDGSNLVVLISMFLVSVSISLGLILHLGMNHVLSGFVGLSLFVGLAGFQLWQRSFSETQALKEEVEFLEAEVERLRTPSAGVSFETVAALKAKDAPLQPSFLEEKTPSSTAALMSSVKENDVEKIQSRIKEMLTQVSAPEQTPSVPEDFIPNTETKAPATSSLEKALDSLRNAAQSLRPKSEQVLEPLPSALLSPSNPSVLSPSTFSSSAPSPSVLSPSTLSPSALSSSEPSPSTPSYAAPVSFEPASVSEVSFSPEPAQQTSPGPDFKIVQEAVQNGRVEVFLEPILSLSEHAAKHYEVSISLKNPDLSDLGTFESDAFRGLGIRPLVDGARFLRSAVVTERLAIQGRKGSVFTQVRGETLLDPNFTDLIQKDFSSRQSLFPQMVLSFTQADIRTFRSDEQMAVTRLAGLGFRFAITDLTDLDMNFEAMSKAGFSYVKIKAAVLSLGLSYPQGQIQAREVTSYLAKFGFTLIVEDIENEDTLARIYGYGALFGQGALFGGRRPVKADFVVRPGQAAA